MLSEFDKALLNIVQRNIPLAERPFALIAEQLGVAEDDVLERLRALKAEGYIRRIGPFFDSTKLGYEGTLIALEVAEGAMEAVATAVNAYPGVTHNYEREGRYNLWLTLLAPCAQAKRDVLAELAALPGVKSVMDLPAIRKYKVNVQFTLE